MQCCEDATTAKEQQQADTAPPGPALPTNQPIELLRLERLGAPMA